MDFTLIPITDLPQAVVINQWDIFPIVQDGVTKSGSIDKLPGAASNLAVTVTTGAADLIIPGMKLLTAFAIRSAVAGSFAAGTSVGGSQLLSGESLAAGEWALYSVNWFAGGTDRHIYFTFPVAVVEIKTFILG